MNYFLESNKDFFVSGGKGGIEYEIDTLPQLRNNLSKKLNIHNPNHQPQIEYNVNDDTLFQTINKETCILGVDYIGPSRYYLEKRNIEKDVIVLMNVMITREIGGHILLPTMRFKVNEQMKSLNEIRSYRFKERIDYFLFELKQWYLDNNKVSASRNVFNGNRKWLSQFDSFEGYINFFMLNDFVGKVDDAYKVYNLSSYNINSMSYLTFIEEQPKIEGTNNYFLNLENAYIPKNYINYALGCCNAIKKRTERMETK